MKERLLMFIKDKFNIALIAIQVIAIICYSLSNFSGFFSVLFFVLEGIFFILWGIKLFYKVKKSQAEMEIYSQLPYTEHQKIALRKKQESVNKNNRFIALMLIILGIVLLFSAFSAIF